MKNLFNILLSFLVFSCQPSNNKLQTNAAAKQPPFWNDIEQFKKQDSISFPPKNAILFIGSSSFTMWKDVHDHFPGYTIINRGFGGSSLPDLIRYENDIIYPYLPKQIVIYCGENDLASSDTVTALMVAERFKSLFRDIRSTLPGVSIAFISLKPSPSRRHLFPKMREANKLIRDFILSQKNTTFIDVHQPMLGENGEPLPGIFLKDSLHMNTKGYDIWQKQIQPHLLK